MTPGGGRPYEIDGVRPSRVPSLLRRAPPCKARRQAAAFLEQASGGSPCASMGPKPPSVARRPSRERLSGVLLGCAGQDSFGSPAPEIFSADGTPRQARPLLVEEDV